MILADHPNAMVRRDQTPSMESLVHSTCTTHSSSSEMPTNVATGRRARAVAPTIPNTHPRLPANTITECPALVRSQIEKAVAKRSVRPVLPPAAGLASESRYGRTRVQNDSDASRGSKRFASQPFPSKLPSGVATTVLPRYRDSVTWPLAPMLPTSEKQVHSSRRGVRIASVPLKKRASMLGRHPWLPTNGTPCNVGPAM